MRQVVLKQAVARPDGSPLTEPVFLILLSLAETARHGYALMKDIERLSEGRVRLSTGTLYGALKRLLEEGWIERIELGDSSRDKQSYRLTDLGYEQLVAESARLKQLARAAASRLRVIREV
jgi:DNA-binding PadR family transcriptional regulator